MTAGPASRRMAALLGVTAPVMRFFTQSAYARRIGDLTICDFAVGDPQEMPLPGFKAAMEQARR